MAEVGEVDPLVSGFHVYMKLSGSPTQSTCMTLSLFIFRKLMHVALSGNPESHFFNPPILLGCPGAHTVAGRFIILF